MRKLILLFIPVALSFTCVAQRVCYSPEVTAQKRATDPDYDNQVRMTEEGLRKFVGSGQADAVSGNRVVRTIPVVVHVLYNTSAQNVSTASIQMMINQMNQDYSKTNPDLTQARNAVQPLAADAQIQFCLAQQTPTGQPTNGINRVATAEVCFDPNTESDKMKSSSTNGVNAWDTRYYLNFWIVSLCGNTQFSGIGGYAYLPTATNGLHGTSIDGIVIDYYWGMMQGSSAWTHEVGHYLGLHHTWGDLSGNACGNVFPGTDDGFNDTPDSRDPNYGCTPITSCSANSPYGDLFEDFMDYSDCSVLFTTQQVNYMNNILTTVRSSLFSTNVCSATGAPIASFTANPVTICTGEAVNFTNTSTGSGNTYSWTFTGGTPPSSTATNPTVAYNTPGTYTVSLTATNANGNNTNTQTNLIVVSGNNSLPLIQGFESTTFPPTGWTILNADASTTWVRSTSASGFGTSSACAFVNNYNYSSISQKDWLITPAYNFTGVSGGRIRWEYAYAPYPQTGYSDSLDVLYSTDCGATWVSLWKRGGTGLGTAIANSNSFVPNASQWRRDSVSLTSLSGQASVRFAFKNANQYGNNIFLDNINIYNTSTQPVAPVADFIGTPTTVVVGNTGSFTDISTNSPTGWSWTFAGGTPGTSNVQNPTITYNTVGTYTVTLTASNAVGNNTMTKTGYINVIQAGGQVCDTLDNTTAQDTAVYYLVPTGLGSGYLSGNNSFGDLAKAEFYTNSQSRQIMGAYYLFAKAVVNGTGTIQACVWDASGTGGSPGPVPLASVSVNIVTISTNISNQNYTYVSFPTTPTVTGNFYVGFIMPTGPGDTVVIATTTIGSPSIGQGWEQYYDNSWHTYSEFWGQYVQGFEVSNLVYPVLCTAGTGPTASFTANNTSICAGSSVNFTSTSSGGPTSYSWTFTGGSPSTSTAQNPSVTYNTAGTYSVSLTVSNNSGNSTSTQNNFITVYARPTLTTTSTSVLCFGGSTGSATVNATGGTPLYTYGWSGGGSTPTISNKPAGTYTVTVSDARQCSAVASVNIGQPLDPLSLVPNATDAVCNQQNGSASVNATGGAGGYTYLWSTGATVQTLSNVGAGMYSVTVRDANNCSATTSMTINNTASNFAVTINSEDATCGLNNGSAVALPNSSFGVTYVWSTGSNSGSISSLAPGSYSVTVTNNAGCTAFASVFIASGNPVNITFSVTPATCSQSNGAIASNASGGSGVYTYIWSTGATTPAISNLPAGAYSITVNDNNGCSAMKATSLSNTGAPSLAFNATHVSGVGNDGSITVYAVAGTPPFTYEWSNGDTSQTISNLTAGTYWVTVTDNAGCQAVSSATIIQITGIAPADEVEYIKVYPSPANDICFFEIELSAASNIQLQLFNNLGQQVWYKQAPAFKKGTEAVDISRLAGGVYLLAVTSAGGVTSVRRFVVNH